MKELFSPESHLIPHPKWCIPSLDSERGELERTARDLGIDVSHLISAFQEGVMQDLSDESWSQLVNADSCDTTWTLEEVRLHLEKKRDFTIIEKGFFSGDTFPAPIILFRKNSSPYLVAGNSRLLACRALAVRPKVFSLFLKE